VSVFIFVLLFDFSYLSDSAFDGFAQQQPQISPGCFLECKAFALQKFWRLLPLVAIPVRGAIS
jgi:hypothetical protein